MWASRQRTRSTEADADEPAKWPIVFLERNRSNDEHLFELDLELARGEHTRLGSGGGLIRPEDAVFVSHDYHAMPRRWLPGVRRMNDFLPVWD
jgi:hypothetical protein